MADRRPNVLVVMTDEQSADTLGYHGNPAARTPHLDALAEQSTSFDTCYTPFPLCCPSRASLWTGLMPRHHHVLGNWQAINPEVRTGGVAAAFQAAGYHTVYTGKWHVPGTTPQRMGFADCSAIPAILDGRDRGRYIEPYRAYLGELGYELVQGHIENLTPADLANLRDPAAPHRGQAQVPLEHYLETWQTAQFLQSLDRRPADRPWFAVCSFNAPHFPLLVPAPFDTLIDRAAVPLPPGFQAGPATKPAEVQDSPFASKFADLDEAGWIDTIAHYLGFCTLVDRQLGQILDHVQRAGELDRTIVVFTSDHGDMMGAHRLIEKGHPLHYEQTTRVPLLIRHPDGRASRTSNLVSVVDIGLSLADLAGVPWSGTEDARSLATMVGDPTASATRTHVTAESVYYADQPDNGHYRAPDTWDPATDALNLSVRTPTERYIYRSHDVDELYDRRVDPGEEDNIAAEDTYAGLRSDLRGLLARDVSDVFPQVASALTAEDH